MIKFLSPCVALVWATIWVAQCQTTSKPHRAPSHRAPSHSAQTEKTAVKPTGVISGDQFGILVSADWMRRYKILEQKHGSIPADQKIYMEGEEYRIPSEVADHFSDMVRAMEAPK